MTQTTVKATATRAAIFEAALSLFTEHGYDKTTMRMIADTAHVSLGNFYYYFPSKEHLVQAFYQQTHEQHRAACRSILESETDLRTRVSGVLLAHIDVLEDYRSLSTTLVRLAADPNSPLSPFSAESRPLRDQVIDIFAEVLRGSKTRISPFIADELPTLLWAYQMSILYFWVYDNSPNRQRTRDLIENTSSLVVRLIGLARIPILRPAWRSAIAVTKQLRAS